MDKDFQKSVKRHNTIKNELNKLIDECNRGIANSYDEMAKTSDQDERAEINAKRKYLVKIKENIQKDIEKEDKIDFSSDDIDKIVNKYNEDIEKVDETDKQLPDPPSRLDEVYNYQQRYKTIEGMMNELNDVLKEYKKHQENPNYHKTMARRFEYLTNEEILKGLKDAAVNKVKSKFKREETVKNRSASEKKKIEAKLNKSKDEQGNYIVDKDNIKNVVPLLYEKIAKLTDEQIKEGNKEGDEGKVKNLKADLADITKNYEENFNVKFVKTGDDLTLQEVKERTFKNSSDEQPPPKKEPEPYRDDLEGIADDEGDNEEEQQPIEQQEEPLESFEDYTKRTEEEQPIEQQNDIYQPINPNMRKNWRKMATQLVINDAREQPMSVTDEDDMKESSKSIPSIESLPDEPQDNQQQNDNLFESSRSTMFEEEEDKPTPSTSSQSFNSSHTTDDSNDGNPPDHPPGEIVLRELFNTLHDYTPSKMVKTITELSTLLSPAVLPQELFDKVEGPIIEQLLLFTDSNGVQIFDNPMKAKEFIASLRSKRRAKWLLPKQLTKSIRQQQPLIVSNQLRRSMPLQPNKHLVYQY